MATVIGKRKRAAAAAAASQSAKATAAPSPLTTSRQVNGKKFATPPTKRTGSTKVASDLPTAGDDTVTIDHSTHEATADETLRSLDGTVSVQIVVGTYERILHGICATIPATLLNEQASEDGKRQDQQVSFTDTFLFSAHSSSIRCIAVSPSTENDKRILATGSSDERVNVYSVSTIPPKPQSKATALALSGLDIAENSRNRSLGSLIHHERAITSLDFPAKGKLFSAAEDNTIAISRTRDWTVLSSIKAPIPTPQGRPSGDTAAPGEVPAGVNDFAIHPSQKLMLTVSKGEKCMRLWNLMTGKKAGVLSFARDLLIQAGESKFSTGEGRSILWDPAGEMFVVAFERRAVVFGIDSEPIAVIKPTKPTKLHRMRFLPGKNGHVLAAATESGSILLFDTKTHTEDGSKALPTCNVLGEVGGVASGVSNRIKDFSILSLGNGSLLVVAGSSDGIVRLWSVSPSVLDAMQAAQGAGDTAGQVGVLVGNIDTSKRITCLDAFLLDGKTSDLEVDADGDEAAHSEGEEASESEDSE